MFIGLAPALLAILFCHLLMLRDEMRRGRKRMRRNHPTLRNNRRKVFKLIFLIKEKLLPFFVVFVESSDFTLSRVYLSRLRSFAVFSRTLSEKFELETTETSIKVVERTNLHLSISFFRRYLSIHLERVLCETFLQLVVLRPTMGIVKA